MSGVVQRNTGYKILPQEDPIDIEYKPRHQRDPRLDDLVSILHSLGWIFIALLTWYYADIPKVITTRDERIATIPLYLFFLSLLVIAGCMSYIVFMQYKTNNPNPNYLEVYPTTIHIATFASFTAFLMITIAIWPIWGFKSIFIAFFNMMALLLVSNLFMYPIALGILFISGIAAYFFLTATGNQ